MERDVERIPTSPGNNGAYINEKIPHILVLSLNLFHLHDTIFVGSVCSIWSKHWGVGLILVLLLQGGDLSSGFVGPRCGREETLVSIVPASLEHGSLDAWIEPLESASLQPILGLRWAVS